MAEILLEDRSCLLMESGPPVAPGGATVTSNTLSATTAGAPGAQVVTSNTLSATTPGRGPFDGADVLAALQAWWRATPTVMALAADGRMWFREAPEDTPLPYVTFFLASDVAEVWTTAYAWQRSSVQVNFHAARSRDARAMTRAFREAVTGAPLSIDGEPVAHVLPDGEGLEVGEGLGPDGQDCWVAFQVLDIPFTQ